MKEIDFVLDHYLTASTVGGPDHLQRRKIVGSAPVDVDIVVETALPAFLEKLVIEQGRSAFRIQNLWLRWAT